MTVDAIAAKGWAILDEGEGDWKSHAAAIAQSIQLIKKRLQVDFDPKFAEFLEISYLGHVKFKAI